jgi:hypothetical protein
VLFAQTTYWRRRLVREEILTVEELRDAFKVQFPHAERASDLKDADLARLAAELYRIYEHCQLAEEAVHE